jgi:YggT family protein
VYSINDAGIFLIQTLAGIFLLLVLLRLLLQCAKADFYNPIVQSLVRITQPAITPLQSLLPTIGRINLAVFGLALVVQVLIMVAVLLLQQFSLPSVFQLLAWSLLRLASQIIDIYFFAILFTVVLSWLAPRSLHPGAVLLYQLTEPLMGFVRRLLPDLGGLDFSPVLLLIMINLIDILVIKNLAAMFAMPSGLVPGL